MKPYALSLVLCLLFALLGGPAEATTSDYKIQVGDALEISVAGLPDFKQRSIVGLDGRATIPMIEPIQVAGLDLAAAQKLAKEELSHKLYQQRTPDGRDSVVAISPDAVTLAIAEYRPVYLNGDVSKPGAEPYRPGMTVRQAIALAGGFEIMRFRMNNPFLESADLRNDYQTLWMQYVKEQARIWRLNSELGRGASLSLDQLTEAPLPKDVLSDLRADAKQQYTLAVDRHAAETAYLTRAVDVEAQQVALLQARKSKDDENVQVDVTEYNKLKEFAANGNLAMTRLSESRRLFLFSATQALQTSVQLTSTTRDRDETRRRIARLDEEFKSKILDNLEEATVNLNSVRSRLQAVSDKITYTGMIRSQLSRGAGSKPSLHIIRAASNGGGDRVADEETEVMPGDTVEVALHTEVPSQ